MFTEEDNVLDNVEKLLISCPFNKELYQNIIDQLSPLVSRTVQDEGYRTRLASSFSIWKQLKTCMDVCEVDKIMSLGDDEHLFWYLRTVRGLILLMRNLSVSNQEIPQELLLQYVVINLFTKINTFNFKYDDMETSTYIAIVSFLHNVTKTSVVFDKTVMDPLMKFLQYPMEHPEKKKEMLFPFLLYFVNLTGCDDFLYYFFRHNEKDKILYDFLVKEMVTEHTHILQYIHDKDNKLLENQLDAMDTALLKLFGKLSYNESFGLDLQNLETTNEETFLKVLKLLQLVITSSENWDKFQLTGIMTWCFKIFENASTHLEQYFAVGKDDEGQADKLHEKLYITLDIISSLSKFEHVLKFLISYDGVKKLVVVLQLLQDNLIRVNFSKDTYGKVKDIKTTNSIGEKIEDKEKISNRVDYDNSHIKSTNFPEIKLLIIEILANLTYKNKEVQDQMRDYHGLQLVLSNCVIDDNDPFIKERSIVCIRFLLEGNSANQSFVAQLEAKRAIQNDVLDEAGYEVNIGKGGEIGLLPKKDVE